MMTREEWILKWLDELIGMSVQFYAGDASDMTGRGSYVRTRANLARAFLAKQFDAITPKENLNGTPKPGTTNPTANKPANAQAHRP